MVTIIVLLLTIGKIYIEVEEYLNKNLYSDKLSHIQVVNSLNTSSPMCTHEDALA